MVAILGREHAGRRKVADPLEVQFIFPELRASGFELGLHGSQRRFSAADGEWRVAFAFDTRRKAILLVAGDKSGVGEKRFYRELMRKADDRFDAHLARLKRERK